MWQIWGDKHIAVLCMAQTRAHGWGLGGGGVPAAVACCVLRVTRRRWFLMQRAAGLKQQRHMGNGVK